MVSEELLEKLESLPTSEFDREVYRHTIGRNPWDKANVRGGRWNPPDVAALYSSLDRGTAIAEGDHLLNAQPITPQVRRVVHRVRVRLERVLDLGSLETLADLGIDKDELEGDDHWACQHVAEAADHLELDGIIVPSARADGRNLVIFSRNSGQDMEHLEEEVIADHEP